MNRNEFAERITELVKQLGNILPTEKIKMQRERRSKHMGKNYRNTKKYADDRQKAPHNRRANGMRRRK